ncbi:MAG: cytochrome c biogenesis protein CcdA [Termitinemataceae bacterium]|nr:MAG: cytochrome c biogenesis protein CcdA [Termitinemataceae bacterium]
MGNNISIISAFAAGVLSFLSPCVLPLLSTYLVFISGQKNHTVRRNLIISTLMFILGFSAVFIGMSVLLYGFFVLLGGISTILNIIAGIIIIIFGANIIFNFLPFLSYSQEETCETCTPNNPMFSKKRPKGYIGAFIVGIAFGISWTPCVGTFLGSILLMAGQSDQMALSVVYLAFFSAGLGLPFLAVSVFWNSLLVPIAKLKTAMNTIRIISGIFLIMIGLLMASNRFAMLNTFFFKAGYTLEKLIKQDAAGVHIVPAVIFFVIAIIPVVIAAIRKQKLIKAKLIVPFTVFFILAIINLTGLINIASLVSIWLTFSGL